MLQILLINNSYVPLKNTFGWAVLADAGILGYTRQQNPVMLLGF